VVEKGVGGKPWRFAIGVRYPKDRGFFPLTEPRGERCLPCGIRSSQDAKKAFRGGARFLSRTIQEFVKNLRFRSSPRFHALELVFANASNSPAFPDGAASGHSEQ